MFGAGTATDGLGGFPDEYRVHCSVYVRALRQACTALGVDVRGDGRVTELKETESGVAVSIDGRDTALADQAWPFAVEPGPDWLPSVYGSRVALSRSAVRCC